MTTAQSERDRPRELNAELLAALENCIEHLANHMGADLDAEDAYQRGEAAIAKAKAKAESTDS